MADKGKSYRNGFGDYTHYNSKGQKTGTSRRGTFGDYTHYDAKGNKTGSSRRGSLGSYTHYDARGKQTGRTTPGSLGSYNHYDARGNKVGGSARGSLGSYSHNDTGGCYVATCVYGSYDCPEVWTLRRFRDDILEKSWAGRLFIRTYYAVSPGLVRRFGAYAWFRNTWKPGLDRLVRSLKSRGVEDTPYQDKHW